jgi:hypothetical protein
MNTVKRLNVIGLSLEILGVLLIALSDYFTRKAEAEFDAIPGNPFVETFESELKDEIRFASIEERNYNATSKSLSSVSKLWLFRTGLGLIAFGMGLQLIAQWVEP